MLVRPPTRKYTGLSADRNMRRNLVHQECPVKVEAGKGISDIRAAIPVITGIGRKDKLKRESMAKANVRRGDTGHGAEFINERRAVDEAINERMKSEGGTDKVDPRSANNKTKAEYKPHDSTKKTGRSKH